MSNVFSFTARLGSDAEVRKLPSGQSVMNFSTAHNVGFGDREQTIWIRVAVWGKRSESKLVDYLKKGQQVFISGELSQSEYEGKTYLELNANIVDLVGGKKEGGGSDAEKAQNAGQDQQRKNEAPQASNDPDDDLDIPF